ncbi:hypothetical protein D3C84_1202670 [compost metagenome]
MLSKLTKPNIRLRCRMEQLELMRAFAALVWTVKRQSDRDIRCSADNRFQRFVFLRREAMEPVDINFCALQ